MVKSTGNAHACLGGIWTLLPITPSELDATNSAAVSLCVSVDTSDATKFQFIACGGDGGGSSTIKTNTTTYSQASGADANSTPTSSALILTFGTGFDVTATTTSQTDDTANIGLDFVERPVVLTTEVTGTLPLANGGTAAITAVAARGTLGAAASGANSDITSITGLSTPLAASQGGTGQALATADGVPVGNGSAFVVRVIPNCPTTNQLLYDSSTDTFGCEADGGGGSGIEGSEEGADVTAATRNRIDFYGAAITLTDDTVTPAVKVTLSQIPTGSTSVVGTTATLTAGAGLSGGGDLSANRTFATDSSETNFLSSTTLASCSSTPGKISVGAAQMDYCDGSTNTLRHTALGDTAGAALTGDSATSFFSTGTLESGIGGTGTTSLGTSGEVLISAGSSITTASAGAFTYNDAVGGGTVTAGTFTTSGGSDGTFGSLYRDNVANPSAPSALFTFFYSQGGEFLKKDSADGSGEGILFLNSGNDSASGDVTVSGTAGVSTYTVGDSKIVESMLNAANSPTTGDVLTSTSGGTGFTWAAASAGSGDVTAVGAGCATGACWTDTVVTSGTVMWLWEGTASDANQFTLNVPANPTAVISWTVPDATTALTFFSGTDTVVGKATTDTLTNKTISASGTGNDITVIDKIWFASAGCNNATAASFFDLPTANAPALACATGTNLQKGILSFDDTTDESAQSSLILPGDWVSGAGIDGKIVWYGAATTGAVGWCVQLVCEGDGEAVDPSFPTQAAGNCVSDTAGGTTLRMNVANLPAGITATGCAAGELMHIKVSRDANGDAVTDGFTGDAHFVGLELTYSRLE